MNINTHCVTNSHGHLLIWLIDCHIREYSLVTLYINLLLFSAGEKIKELHHPLLKETADMGGWIHDISVSDGRMVVACRDEGVMYFNLL